MTLRINLGKLVLLSTTSLVLVFGSIDFYWIHRQTKNALTAEMNKRSIHHARSLAVEVVDEIALGDRLLMKRLLDGVRSLDPEIAYAFLVGARGELLAHTFNNGFPAELLTANPLPPGRDFMVRRIVDKAGREEPIVEVVAPISGGRAGFVHVGFQEESIQASVTYVTHAVSGMVIVFVLLGILASLLMTRVVTRPLQKLAAASRRVNLEALPGSDGSLLGLLPPPTSRLGLHTEVDRLAEEFREMLQRLSEAYRQLEKAQEQLAFAERMSTLGQVAAGLAHELNNPLAGLRNCLRRIRREPEDREQLQRYLLLMLESVDRMQMTLQGLLDLAKPRVPKLRLVRILPLLDRVVVLADAGLTEARVIPTKRVVAGATVVWADESLLEQTLLNLVLNSCASLNRRGQQDPEFSPELTICGFRRDGRVWIEVRDNGVGIKVQDLPHVFDPFFTTKVAGRGTGLGLSIAQELTRVQQGEIQVESQEGRGATFRVVLQDVGIHESIADRG